MIGMTQDDTSALACYPGMLPAAVGAILSNQRLA